MTLRKRPLKKIVGTGENAGNQHFLHFPQCFLTFPNQISISYLHQFCRLQMLSIWASLKFCCLVKDFFLQDEDSLSDHTLQQSS